ncbi:hypothetical protein [uncultured Marivirga sp.]|uniref:hypothetical protein n=1 Tax=uncultured Marivirga sp. TaxID=1123707 RepID=UPI0030EBBF2C|tara:strand:- start:76598 stop:77131 length:534 start_codon:yes stop_codon:yes gene_type:complete
MKTKLFAFLSILSSVFLLTACPLDDDQIDELLKIEGPIEQSKSYSFILEEGDELIYVKEESFSTTYKGIDISEVELNALNITYDKIENPEEWPLKVTFGLKDSGMDPFTFTNTVIKEDEGRTIGLLDISDALAPIYEQYLLDNPEAIIQWTIESFGAPVRYDLTLDITMTVTGTPTN